MSKQSSKNNAAMGSGGVSMPKRKTQKTIRVKENEETEKMRREMRRRKATSSGGPENGGTFVPDNASSASSLFRDESTTRPQSVSSALGLGSVGTTAASVSTSTSTKSRTRLKGSKANNETGTVSKKKTTLETNKTDTVASADGDDDSDGAESVTPRNNKDEGNRKNPVGEENRKNPNEGENVTPRNNKDEGKEPGTTAEGQPCQTRDPPTDQDAEDQPCQTLDPPTEQDARKNSHPDLRMSKEQSGRENPDGEESRCPNIATILLFFGFCWLYYTREHMRSASLSPSATTLPLFVIIIYSAALYIMICLVIQKPWDDASKDEGCVIIVMIYFSLMVILDLFSRIMKYLASN